MKFKSAIIGALALLAPSLVQAAPLTWTLTNAVFADGGTASGSFVWDADTLTFGDYQFSTTGGDTDTFPDYVYSSTGAGAGEYPYFESTNVPLFIFSRPDDSARENGQRTLYLSLVSLLTNAGGDVGLDLTSNIFPGGECYYCAPYRAFVSGSVVAEGIGTGDPGGVPEPGAWTLMLLGFGAMGVALRRRPAGIAASA